MELFPFWHPPPPLPHFPYISVTFSPPILSNCIKKTPTTIILINSTTATDLKSHFLLFTHPPPPPPPPLCNFFQQYPGSMSDHCNQSPDQLSPSLTLPYIPSVCLCVCVCVWGGGGGGNKCNIMLIIYIYYFWGFMCCIHTFLLVLLHVKSGVLTLVRENERQHLHMASCFQSNCKQLTCWINCYLSVLIINCFHVVITVLFSALEKDSQCSPHMWFWMSDCILNFGLKVLLFNIHWSGDSW